ncbi:MAG: hypothetical protein DRN68_06905 [Thaumarchaeota archaeon]|nr:MAG: hypothetical protein DRN68_06905 [Nitrososphaerota archaeon]
MVDAGLVQWPRKPRLRGYQRRFIAYLLPLSPPLLQVELQELHRWDHGSNLRDIRQRRQAKIWDVRQPIVKSAIEDIGHDYQILKLVGANCSMTAQKSADG